MSSQYKYLAVKEALLQQIRDGRLKPGEKLLSEQEYAEVFQVSLITIRKAMTELANEGIIVRMRKKGTFVSDTPSKPSTPSHLIAVIISANAQFDISYMKIIKGIQYMAALHHYSIIVEWCENDQAQEEAAIHKMLKQNVEGFILYLSNPSASRNILSLIEEKNILYVLIDRCDISHTSYYSGCDNFAGGMLATQELLKFHHRKIKFAAYDYFLPTEQERFDGFCCALRREGISVDDSFLIQSVNIDVLAKQIRSKELTALFCCNDRLAVKIIQALAKADIHTPNDFSIIGFDEWDESLNNSIGLTTIRQNFDEIGRNSFYLLHSALQGMLTNNNIKLLSGVSIVYRNSVIENRCNQHAL